MDFLCSLVENGHPNAPVERLRCYYETTLVCCQRITRAYVRVNRHTVVQSTEGESLVLRYQVTSLPDLPIVELTFLNVAEWKVPNGELFGSMISFELPFVTLFEGNIPENAKALVKARNLYWRIVDRPGNRLQRGGTKDAPLVLDLLVVSSETVDVH